MSFYLYSSHSSYRFQWSCTIRPFCRIIAKKDLQWKIQQDGQCQILLWKPLFQQLERGHGLMTDETNFGHQQCRHIRPHIYKERVLWYRPLICFSLCTYVVIYKSSKWLYTLHGSLAVPHWRCFPFYKAQDTPSPPNTWWPRTACTHPAPTHPPPAVHCANTCC